MATTTLGTPNRTTRPVNPLVYWAIGAVVVIALIVFFAMRTNNSTATGTGVDRSNVSDTTTGPAVNDNGPAIDQNNTMTPGTNGTNGVNGGADMDNGTTDQNMNNAGPSGSTTNDTNAPANNDNTMSGQ